MNHCCCRDLHRATFDPSRFIQPIPSGICEWFRDLFGSSQDIHLKNLAIFADSQFQLNNSRHTSEHICWDKRARLPYPLRRFGCIRGGRR
jgi:hypothetical protein